MTKQEFETSIEPLCLIVSIDISTGKVLYDTYPWDQQDLWIMEIDRDFPKMISFSKLNKAGISARRKLFGLSDDD